MRAEMSGLARENRRKKRIMTLRKRKEERNYELKKTYSRKKNLMKRKKTRPDTRPVCSLSRVGRDTDESRQG